VNVSSLHLPTALPHLPRELFDDSIFQPLSSDIRTFAGGAATAIDSAVSSAATAAHGAESAAGSVIQSAETAAATAIQNATQTFVDTRVPKNISIGTKNLCFGYYNDTSDCYDLPLNISDVLPGVVSNVLGNQVQTLQQLEQDLVGKILGLFHRSLIAGIVFILILGVVILCLWRFLPLTRLWVRLLIALISGVLCLIPFVIPTVIIFLFQSKLNKTIEADLSSILQVQNGEVNRYVLGAVCCMVVMLAAGIVTLVL
jgi:hypothetical protein